MNSPVNLTDPSGHDPWWQDSYQGAGKFVMPPGPKVTTTVSTPTPGPSASPPTQKAGSTPPASGSCTKTQGLIDCTNNSAFDQAASTVLTADQAGQAATDSAWGSLWRQYYAETVKALMERNPGMSLQKADQVAFNLAKMNIAKGGGAFLSDLSRKLGVAGAVGDAMLTFSDCQKGLGPCLLKSSVHFGTGMAGVVVGGAVVEACVEFAWTGPWGCAGAGLIAGGVTTLGLNAVTDTVIDIYLPDQPQPAPDPHP
jgi:hypothetical protein